MKTTLVFNNETGKTKVTKTTEEMNYKPVKRDILLITKRAKVTEEVAAIALKNCHGDVKKAIESLNSCQTGMQRLSSRFQKIDKNILHPKYLKMNAVKLLQENESQLKLSWSQGYHRDNTRCYMGLQSEIGLKGPGWTETVYEPRTEPPEYLAFYISFLQDNDELYSKLNTFFPMNSPPTYTQNERRIKAEFQEKVAQLEAENKEKCARIQELLDEADSLGCYFDDGYSMPSVHIPDNFYEDVAVEKRRLPSFTILCGRNDEIYQALKTSGLLEKYCPEDYRKGIPYCNGSGVWQCQPVISEAKRIDMKPQGQQGFVGAVGPQGCYGAFGQQDFVSGSL